MGQYVNSNNITWDFMMLLPWPKFPLSKFWSKFVSFLKSQLPENAIKTTFFFLTMCLSRTFTKTVCSSRFNAEQTLNKRGHLLCVRTHTKDTLETLYINDKLFAIWKIYLCFYKISVLTCNNLTAAVLKWANKQYQKNKIQILSPLSSLPPSPPPKTLVQ